MAIAGTFPEQGVRVALELRAVGETNARYDGEAFTPNARYALVVTVEIATGKSVAEVTSTHPREGTDAMPLEAGDLAFAKQLGVQLWKQARAPAEQGGGTWARRVQRWRGPK